MKFRDYAEIILWFAFAWIYLFYAIYASYRGDHIGVAGAIMALVGALELAVVTFAGLTWTLVWVMS